MMKILKLFILIGIMAFMSGCYYDNLEDLYPVTNNINACDTTNVTYTSTMKTFFDNKCAGCHNGSHASCNLNNYTNAQSYVVAHGMALYNKVTSTTPHNSITLTDCEKKQLRIWITNNAPN